MSKKKKKIESIKESIKYFEKKGDTETVERLKRLIEK